MDVVSKKKTNNFLIVVNPKSGTYQKGAIQDHLTNIQISNPNRIYYFYDQEGLERRLKVALEEGVDLFAAAGGDGTVSLLANSLRDKDVTLGIIPIGTGNTLTQILGIPADSETALV